MGDDTNSFLRWLLCACTNIPFIRINPCPSVERIIVCHSTFTAISVSQDVPGPSEMRQMGITREL